MKLETRHIQWIFEAAGNHFSDKIIELETEIARHRQFMLEPVVNSSITDPPTRRAAIENAQMTLDEFRVIAAFCREARLTSVRRSAEEFVQTFKHSFNFEAA